MDLNNFFKAPDTNRIIERSFVTDDNIDNEDYVEGSQGNLKEIRMITESNVKGIGENIEAYEKVFVFYYEDAENPDKYTSMQEVGENNEYPRN